MKRIGFYFCAALFLSIFSFSISYAADPGCNGDPTKQVMEQSADGAKKKKWKKAVEAIDTAAAVTREAAESTSEKAASRQEDKKEGNGNSAAQNNKNTVTRGSGTAMTGRSGMGGGMNIGGKGRQGGMFFPGGNFRGGSSQQPGTGGGSTTGQPAGGDSSATQDPSGSDTTEPSGSGTTTTEEPTESSDLNELIEQYTSATDEDTARQALSDIVDLIESDSSLEEAFIDYFGLSGTALEIWETYSVLVIDSDGGTAFSEAQLSGISDVLASLPEDDVAVINVITTTTASEGSSDSLLGFTYTDTDNATVVINTSSSYFSDSSDGLQTFASTLCHEIGHRVQFALSSEDSAEFTALHEASGNDAQNYASTYGMTEYSSDDPGYEDFATMYEAWCTDSETLIARAESQAASGSSVLLEKVKFMAELFSHTGSDGNTYTYIYTIGSDGTITRTEVLLGSDGLPVIS